MIRAGLAYVFYRWLAFPIAYLLTHLALPFLPVKLRSMIEDRRGRKLPPLLSAPIWIHAASGEIEYAKPVIRAVKEKYPELPILVTYFSPSAKKLILNYPGVDLALASPWDLVSDVDEFLDFYKPRAGLFARTDVWPTLVTRSRERGIPLLLFAATLGANSSRLGFGRAALSRWALSRLSDIFCVSADDAANFQRVGMNLPLHVSGDTRYDQVFARLEGESKLPEALAPLPDDFVLVAGSTWPEDEEVLLACTPSLLKNRIRLILVPHEIHDEHLRDLEWKLQSFGARCRRYSQAQSWSDCDVLLVDQVGKLADLYRWGDVAFVGGSFKEKIHSVMEPLAAGLPVLVGPRHENNREALQFQSVRLTAGDSAVHVIRSARDLEERLLFWKKKGPCHAELSEIVRKRTGASTHVLEWLEEHAGLGANG